MSEIPPSMFSRADIPKLVGTRLKPLNRAAMAWNDEYMHIKPQRLATARLTKKLDKAKEYKNSVADIIIQIKSSVTSAADLVWVTQVEAQAKILRESFCRFVSEADRALGLRERSLVVENAAAANAKVKNSPVDANLTSLAEEMEKMKVTFGELDTTSPYNKPALKMHMDNKEAAKANSRELVDNAKELVDDDTNLDKNIQALKQAEAKKRSVLIMAALTERARQLRKLGASVGNSTKHRESAMDIMGRPESLEVIAKNYKLQNKLYNSLVVGETQAGLSGQMLKAFKEKVAVTSHRTPAAGVHMALEGPADCQTKDNTLEPREKAFNKFYPNALDDPHWVYLRGSVLPHRGEK